MVYVFLAEGFEEIEALTPVDILRRGGVEVITVGVGTKIVKGSHKICVNADAVDSDISDFSDMEAVILPGGMPGTLNLEKCETVLNAVKYCADNNLVIGAICAAPSVLGHMGLLQNKKAVCYPSFENELKGAVPCDAFVCRDGNIITAKGMGVSVDFALELLSAIKGCETSDDVRNSIQCL